MDMKTKAIGILGCAAAIWAAFLLPAGAQTQTNQYYAPDGSTVPAIIEKCQNAQGQAVDCNSLSVAPRPVQVTNGSPVAVAPSPYPAGAQPLAASATGTTAATTATLTGTAGKTTYICGFSINASATAVTEGNATITGTTGGTLNFEQGVQALTAGVAVTSQAFAPCIPSATVGGNIAAVSAAAGSGGVVSVTAWGYRL
jgi:hypothetical protein